MPLRRLPAVLLAAAALLAGGCVSLRVPVSPAPRVAATTMAKAEADRAKANLRVFDMVWDRVNRQYYDRSFNGLDWAEMARTHGPRATAAPDPQALYGAINAMLDQLDDSHTAALPPRQANEERTGQRAVVGIRLRRVDGRWVVTEVNPGGTAARAGVRPGWIAIRRNGVELGERYTSPVQQVGDVVRWEFLTPDGRTVLLDLRVQQLATGRREVRELPGGLVYLRFDGFDLGATRWLSQQLTQHRSAPGVVLDLRYNGGGLIASALFAVGEFFPKAVPTFVTLDQQGERFRWASFMGGSANYQGRVAVLVGPESASAAEILSAALQEKGRAIIVGRRTAGALLAATQVKLPDGGLLQVSGLDVITMGGRRLEGVGLEPDVEVPPANFDQLRTDSDPDLEAAIKVLTAP